MFIIEGADCTGKTTLAKFLARRIGATYAHASGHQTLHGGMLAYHLEILRDARVNLSMGRSVVLDRHWPSEVCYGETLRPAVTRATYSIGTIWRELDQIVDNLASIHYVFCFSSQSAQRQLEQPDNDHPYSAENYGTICAKYLELFNSMIDGAPHRRSAAFVHAYHLEAHGAALAQHVDMEILRGVECE